MSLNRRQAEFADHVAAGASGAEAARRAGYSSRRAGVTGTELMQRPDVQERVVSSREAMLRDAGYDPRQSVADLMAIATTGERDRDRIRAHELLLKLAGAFDLVDPGPEPLSISTERLLALEASLVASFGGSEEASGNARP